MQKNKGKKHRDTWLAALLLFVCVAATTIALTSRLNDFLLDDSGAISLIPVMEVQAEETQQAQSESEEAEGTHAENTDTREEAQDSAESESIDSETVVSPTAESQASDDTSQNVEIHTMEPQVQLPNSQQQDFKPGFEASDDQKVWSTQTQVDIFRVSYENGEQVITVNSNDGDKVIAPGTENSYTFKFKNTGNVALDYTVHVDAYFEPANIEIPITGRINRYDGKWLAGSKDNYVAVQALDDSGDQATLGAGRYTYYTLDWLWPFENGNDAYDTMLGNVAMEQDLVCTIVITTVAMASEDPYASGGINTPPKTGDESMLLWWGSLLVCMSAVLTLLVYYKVKTGERK